MKFSKQARRAAVGSVGTYFTTGIVQLGIMDKFPISVHVNHSPPHRDCVAQDHMHKVGQAAVSQSIDPSL